MTTSHWPLLLFCLSSSPLVFAVSSSIFPVIPWNLFNKAANLRQQSAPFSVGSCLITCLTHHSGSSPLPQNFDHCDFSIRYFCSTSISMFSAMCFHSASVSSCFRFTHALHNALSSYRFLCLSLFCFVVIPHHIPPFCCYRSSLLVSVPT